MLTAVGFIPPLLMLYGFWLRYQKKFHVPVMIAAIIADFGVVALVEHQKKVVERASGGGLDPLLKFHILMAITSFTLYAVLAWTGVLMWKGKSGRRVHRTNGVIVLCTRSLVSLTSAIIACR